MNITFLIGLGALIFLNIILSFMVVKLNQRISQFTRGNNGLTLETLIKKLIVDQETCVKNHDQLVTTMQDIHARVETSHRGFFMMRYNAFEHTGGNQSFSCVFLDELGTGMVLSNLYSRERSNIFAKPIVAFKSEVELSKEEKEVIKQATASLRA
jgi:hypothetical protein